MKPKGKPPVRHSLKVKVEGGGFAGSTEWRPLCGATSWGFPEKWVATEEWLHEIKACPKCKELDPTLQGWDEILKEKYGDAWNDYKQREIINMERAGEERYRRRQTLVEAHTNIPENEPQVKTALYLRSAL